MLVLRGHCFALGLAGLLVAARLHVATEAISGWTAASWTRAETEDAGSLILHFAAGRLLSWLLYQSTWLNTNVLLLDPIREYVPPGWWFVFGGLLHQPAVSGGSLAARYLSQPLWWPVHAVVMAGFVRAPGWPEDAGFLRHVSALCACLLLGKAVGRFPPLTVEVVKGGGADAAKPPPTTFRHLFFALDRLLCLVLAPLVWIHPGWLYPAVVMSCLCAYSINSGRGLPLPISNYLGFEYTRIVACFCIAVLWMPSAGPLPPSVATGPPAVAAVLAAMGGCYYNHGMGKLRLGKTVFSWPLTDRIECLIANSWLRGWPVPAVLAAVVRRLRLPMCLGGVGSELGGLAVGMGWPFAAGVFSSLGLFHCSVTVLSGLCDWEAICLHFTCAYWIVSESIGGSGGSCGSGGDGSGQLLLSALARPGCAVATVGCVVLSEFWVEWCSTIQSDELRMVLADASDLRMAWFDSPYMRMFSYTVTVAGDPSGAEHAFPCTKWAPYDTIITDIHSRLAFWKSSYAGLDRTRTADVAVVKAGVWGLLLQHDQAERMYALQDKLELELERRAGDAGAGTRGAATGDAAAAAADDDRQDSVAAALRNEFCSTHPPPPWVIDDSDLSGWPAVHRQLVGHLQGINTLRLRAGWLYRTLWDRWPHFPGEDWVLDISPLLALPAGDGGRAADGGRRSRAQSGGRRRARGGGSPSREPLGGQPLPVYRLELGPIASLKIWRVKSFWTGPIGSGGCGGAAAAAGRAHKIDQSLVGTIQLGGADGGGGGDGGGDGTPRLNRQASTPPPLNIAASATAAAAAGLPALKFGGYRGSGIEHDDE
eukprot:SAG22_NODE_845_length_6871_cov_3.172327_4_plen_821_part_00